MPAEVTGKVDPRQLLAGHGGPVRVARAPICVAPHDNVGAGLVTRTRDFSVTAPGTPGEYDVRFTPNESDNCNGTAARPPSTLTDGLRVTTPAPNPNLPPRCGINVMLVLDESGSISTSGQTETVKNADAEPS